MDLASFSNVRHWGNNLHRSVWKQIAVHQRVALSDLHTRSYRGLPPAAALSAMQLFAGWKDGVMLKSCLTFTWQTLYHPLLFSSVFRKLAPFILAVFKLTFSALLFFPAQLWCVSTSSLTKQAVFSNVFLSHVWRCLEVIQHFWTFLVFCSVWMSIKYGFAWCLC